MNVFIVVGGSAQQGTVPSDLHDFASPHNDRRQDAASHRVGHLFTAAYNVEVTRQRFGPFPATGRPKAIADEVSTMVAKLLYYDRKEDEDLPQGAIQEALASGEVTLADMVGWFVRELTAGVES